MSSSPVPPSSAPEDVAAFQQVASYWASGQQQPALDILRPRAEAGSGWSAALLSWVLTQQGSASLEEAGRWAIRAAELGSPFQVLNVFNNFMAYLPSMPHLVNMLPDLLRWGAPLSAGIDVVGQAYNLANQGQGDLGLRLLSAPVWFPFSDDHARSIRESFTRGMADIETSMQNMRAKLSQFDNELEEALSTIESEANTLKTSARQADLLVQSVSSDATNALFKEDAKRNEGESRGAWRFGLGVLGVAALVAVLPVALHYLGLGPGYSALEQVGVHLASTAALATFAGVLLARARARDRAAQRAHDLSTAMGTMISYSNQITDPGEKQRFMMAMGQVVLQAHLSTGAAHVSGDESVSGMIALANILKSPSAPNVPPSGG